MIYSNGFKSRFAAILKTTNLSDFNKAIIIARYVHIVGSLERDFLFIQLCYYLLVNLITVGIILVTALISLSKVVGISGAFFWVLWSLSLVVAVANKLLYTFDIHKKHMMYKGVLEKLKSEGWSFLSGSGKYQYCSSADRVEMFFTRVEKIKLKFIESLPSSPTSGSLGAGPRGEAAADVEQDGGRDDHVNDQPSDNA